MPPTIAGSLRPGLGVGEGFGLTNLHKSSRIRCTRVPFRRYTRPAVFAELPFPAVLWLVVEGDLS